eukprot:scaffold318739_cov33-Tisochrysis_lutea.AAC.4
MLSTLDPTNEFIYRGQESEQIPILHRTQERVAAISRPSKRLRYGYIGTAPAGLEICVRRRAAGMRGCNSG